MSVTDDGTKVAAEKTRISFGRDSLLVLAVGISAALPFLLAPLRAQILGPAGRGEFAFFQSTLTTVGVASALGVRIACYQVGFLADSRFRISYVKMSIYSTLAAAVVVVPLFWIALVQFSPLISWMIACLILLAPSFVINQIEFATANYEHDRVRIGNAASLPALVEFFVSMAAFIVQQYTLAVGVLTAVFAQLTRLATAWIWHFRDRGAVASHLRIVDRQIEVDFFKASLKNAPAAIVPLLSGNLDVLIFGLLTTTETLGHYVVAKLGFTALLIAASVLEGRAISLVKKLGRLKGLGMIVLVSGTLAVLCGLAGWLLTPIIFGSEFIPSGQAFPLLALAGALAFLFVCISAINAQDRKASFWPGLAILVTLVISCVLLALYFTSDVVIISLGLTLAQAVGVAVVLVQYSSKRGKHR